MLKNKRKKGYSLVEISIALTIIAFIIAGVVAGKSLMDASKINVLNAEMTTIKLAIKSYMEDNKITSFTYPDSSFTSTLINEGYLKTDRTNCYPSRVLGCWYIEIEDLSNNNNYYPKATLQTENLDPVIDTAMCDKFAKKYSDTGVYKYEEEVCEEHCQLYGYPPYTYKITNFNSTKNVSLAISCTGSDGYTGGSRDGTGEPVLDENGNEQYDGDNNLITNGTGAWTWEPNDKSAVEVYYIDLFS